MEEHESRCDSGHSELVVHLLHHVDYVTSDIRICWSIALFDEMHSALEEKHRLTKDLCDARVWAEATERGGKLKRPESSYLSSNFVSSHKVCDE